MYYNTKTYTFSLTKHTLKNYGDERPKASILMSTTWNIWKARNCQVFNKPEGNTDPGRRRDQAGDRAAQESSWRADGV